MTSMRKDDLATVASIGASAFIVACVAHEVIGHGGMCLATGGHVTLISSVYFRATNGGPIVDASGPMANLVLGGLLWLGLRFRRTPSPHLHLFLATAMGLNLFWGSGYFVYSGIANTGDWAFVVRDLALRPIWLWRVILVSLGLYIYGLSTMAVSRRLTRFADIEHKDRSSHPLFRLTLILYLSAGITCCSAAFLFRGTLWPALRESLVESFGASVGLLFIANRRPRTDNAMENACSVVTLDWKWIIISVLCVILFVAVMGRGYFNEPNEAV